MRKSTFTKAHKLLACLMVVCMLVACLPLSLIASAYQLNADTVLADVDFDENNIVMQFGVLSDQHISYQSDSLDYIANKAQRYANIVAALNKASGNKLNGIISCGDYTSHGNVYQAETFASASKVIFDAINADAAETGITTKFMMTYGNHDTSWGSMMPISEYAYDYQSIANNNNNYYQFPNTSISGKSDTWEELLDEYGLLHDQGATSWDDIDGDGTDDYLEGTYIYSMTATNGKKYYFIGLETITYAPNGYHETTLKWLDKKLAEITSADPTAYVYIASHAPVAGTGIYGTNATYDKNAGWGSTDNDVLHNVLKKYSQVVYFSGHTHYGTMPETAIMSDTYTAIAVSAMSESGIFSNSSGYDYDNAASSSMKNTGLGLLVQVDANGNQKITRVVTPFEYNNVKLMDLSSTENSYNVLYEGNFNQVIFNNATINTDALAAYDVATYGDAYLMPTPDAENNHLRYFSKERGEGAKIAFDADDKVTLSNAVFSSTNGLSATVVFDTATADKNILQYRVTFKKANGTVLKTQMFAGNIYDITSGVSKGTTHCDATELTYIVNNISSTNTSVYAEVVAVDEFGNMSEPIVSNLIDVATVKTPFEKPQYDAKYEVGTNLFDNVVASGVVEYVNANNDVAVDTTNGLTVNVTTMGADSIHYNFTGASYTKVWGMMTANAYKVTGLSPDETMVYEGTYNFSKLGANTYILFRAVDGATVGGQYWNEHQAGLMFNANGTYLMLNNAVVAENKNYKISLNTDHVVKIVSSKDTVSVWVDDVCIFDNVIYTLEGRAVANDGSDDKCPVATYPYYYSGVYLKTKDLYPTVGMYVGGTADSETASASFTVKDQKYYHYYINDRTDYIVQNNNIPGANELTFAGNLNLTVDTATKDVFTSSGNGFVFDLSQAGYDKIGQTNVNIDNYVYPFGYQVYPFAANDTWTFEYDLTAANFISTDPRVKFTLGNVTTKDGVTKDATVMMQGATQFIMNESTWESIANTGIAWNTEGVTTHFKYTVNGNKSIVYEISQGSKKYTYTYDLEAVFGAGYTLTPAVSLSYKKATMDVKNIKISVNGKYGDPIEGMTAPTEQNNLLNTNVNWTSNYKGTAFAPQFFGNNAYFNNYCEAQKINGLSTFYTGYTVDPMPTYGYEQTKSYVVSMNVKKSNRATDPVYGGGTNPYTSRFCVVFGQYGGKEVSAFIDDDNIYTFMNGAYSNFASPVVKAIGLNEYYRYTASITPFGVTLYINGAKVHTIEFSDPSLFVPNVDFRVNGTEIWFKDVAIWENTDNGQVYYDKINDKYQYLTTDKPGVRLDYSAEDQATLNEVKAALDSFNGKDSTPLRPYLSTLNSLRIPTVVNNLVADGSTIVGASASHVLGHSGADDWKYGNLILFNGNSPFTPADDFIVEADLTFTDIWHLTRIGFALNPVADGDVMIQLDTQFANTQEKGWDSSAYGKGPTTKNLANKWHVKYIVKGGESIQTLITDSETGAVLHDYTVLWSTLRTASTNKEYFSPVFYYACCSVELKNIYVGYDVTEAKDALNDTVAEYAVKDTNGFTAESVRAFTDALANANMILGTYKQYSNAEINAAKEAVVNTFAALEVEETIKLPVGDVEIEITPDEELPVNERVDTKFVLGWLNPDGSAYTGTTYVEGLVAEFVETKMMTVKYQIGRADDAIRYIASVDETERYTSVGWLFSIKNTNPEIGGANVVEKNSTIVYSALLANGVEKTTADVYGDVDYSKYFYVFEITDIPDVSADAIIYVRPYVEMTDGRIVYGDVSERSLNDLRAR